MARGGNQPLVSFLDKLGLAPDLLTRGQDSSPQTTAEAIDWLKMKRPSRQRFWPAMTLSLVAQVDSLLRGESLDRFVDLLDETNRVTSSPRGTVQQLTLRIGGSEASHRPYYSMADRAIRSDMLRAHPSAPGHATKNWRDYSGFITLLAETSPAGRGEIAQWIWDHGVIPLPETIVSASRTRRPRPFYELVQRLDTSSGSTGGALYQGIVYAFLSTDSPSLTVSSHKVNVGSSRTGALGDVDGYLGEDIVLAAEAKDRHLVDADRSELTAFMEDVAPHPDVDAVVFARSADEEVSKWLAEEGVRLVTHDELLSAISLWDVPKQENAIRALRYFLMRVQKDPKLLHRVVSFIEDLSAQASTEAGSLQILEASHPSGTADADAAEQP